MDNECHGLLMVYTGDGKGKTTAALGLALRSAGYGMRTLIVQFCKGGAVTGEIKTITQYLPMVEIVQAGRAGFIGADGPCAADLTAAAQGMAMVRRAFLAQTYDLIILDEINVAVALGVVKRETLLELLGERAASQHVVLTGRDACPEIIAAADLVSEVREVKHPYRQGVDAQRGIEY